MAEKNMVCEVTGKPFPQEELVHLTSLREAVVQLLLKDYPKADPKGWVTKQVANEYRYRHVEDLLKEENGELGALDKEVLDKLRNFDLMSRNIEPQIDQEATLGEKVADNIATFGGSWTFILSFMGFLLVWIAINVWVLTTKPFDPYPFILLNLILSCLAALQAPVIMMSQNRQEAKDRLRSEHDYQVNLKAELEIQQLHEKIDHIILKQNQRLLEIQEVQIELLKQLLEKRS